MSYDLNKEVREAVIAGESALESLRLAQKELKSAGNWGIADMLGGGLISGLVKHSKMNNASSYMDSAKSDLKRFQNELRDVSVHTDFNIDIGDFLTFADFFFDGIIADYMVQSKINDAKSQVDQAIQHVEGILYNLKRI